MAKKKEDEGPKEPIIKAGDVENGRWYDCGDHLPPAKEGVKHSGHYICYSHVFRQYYIGRFCPYSGWKDIDGGRLRNVTCWLDKEMGLPFPHDGVMDKKLGEQYGVN